MTLSDRVVTWKRKYQKRYNNSLYAIGVYSDTGELTVYYGQQSRQVVFARFMRRAKAGDEMYIELLSIITQAKLEGKFK